MNLIAFIVYTTGLSLLSINAMHGHVIICCCHVTQGALSDTEEESVSSGLKDLEFKLLHDLTKLQVSHIQYCKTGYFHCLFIFAISHTIIIIMISIHC